MLSRWGWTALGALTLTFIAGMIGGLAVLLPPMPRWTIRSSPGLIGYSPDGRRLATMRWDRMANKMRGPVTIWDVANGQVASTHFPDAFQVQSFDFVPRRANLLFLAVQHQVEGPWDHHLVDVEAGTSRQLNFKLENWNYQRVEYPPTGFIANVWQSSDDFDINRFCILDLETGSPIHEWNDLNVVDSTRVSDSTLLLTCLRGVHYKGVFWDLPTGKVIAETEYLNNYIEISEDKQLAVTKHNITPTQYRMKLWDIPSATVIHEATLPTNFGFVSTDLRWALVGTEEATNPKKPYALWNLRENRRIAAWPFADWDFIELYYEKDEPRILVMFEQRKLQCFDARTMTVIWERIWPADDPVRQHFWNRPTRQLVLRTTPTNFELIDLASGASVRTFVSPREAVELTEFSRLSMQQAHSLSNDGRFLMCNVRFVPDDSPRRRRPMPRLRSILSLEPRTEMQEALAAVDLETGITRFRLVRESFDSALHVSPDATSAVVAYRDPVNEEQVLECWDMPTRKPWGWIFGVSLSVSLATIFMVVLWRHWQNRMPPARMPHETGGGASAVSAGAT